MRVIVRFRLAALLFQKRIYYFSDTTFLLHKTSTTAYQDERIFVFEPVRYAHAHTECPLVSGLKIDAHRVTIT